jgi:hypothetical protein
MKAESVLVLMLAYTAILQVRVISQGRIYCEESVAFEEQSKYCNQGQHLQPRLGFCDEDGE